MQITVLVVTNSTKATDKGSYQILEVTYKDNQGKTGSRKIMSFVQDSKPAYEALVNASGGEVYDITMVKQAGRDGKEYWVWTNAVRSTGAQGNNAQNDTGSSKGTAVASKGNWETPEERAARQVYIVRQSSLSTAVAALSSGKSAPKDVDILKLAKRFEDYVFNGTTGDLVTDISSLEDENLFQELPQ